MRITIDGWDFDIELTGTMEYSAREAASHCTCGYCRNFYETVPHTYPDLPAFLAQFGVDVEAPEEMMPYDVGNEIWCDVFYAVRGRVVQRGRGAIQVNGVDVIPMKASDAQVNCFCPEPCFLLSVGTLMLPWVLDEPMEDVISTANEPEFLSRMEKRLAKRQENDWILS